MRREGGRGVVSTHKLLPIVLGTIVKAPITPDGGVSKPRRSVVFRPPPADESEPIWVLGVTSDNDGFDPADTQKYPPDLYVPMPYAADGSDPTTFTVPCAVKLDWFQRFDRSSIRVTSGYLPKDHLDRLLKKFDAYIAKLREEEKARNASRK
ncbi:MAG: hypothetical protein JWN24_4775 [Phycisphaerales bacterium]|nr:hypothetical protein [Phycisphaerales bacterium]